MALAYVGSPATGSVHGGSTLTVAAPAGLAAGNLVMIAVFGDSRIATDGSGNQTGNPSGFGGAQRSSASAGALFYSKVATSSEPASYTITFSVSVIAVAACVAVSGQNAVWNDPATLPQIYDPGAASTSCAVPGITLAGATDWLIGFFGFGQSVAPGTFSLPAGFTSRIAEFTSGAAASDMGMIAGDVQSIAAGATGTKTATTTGSANYPAGFIVGITPGAGGGTSVAIPTVTAAAAAIPLTPLTGTVVTNSAFFPLGVKVEILVNGTWTDITDHVYQRDTMQITGGRANFGDTAQPAQVTITLNNRDGRFSPLYPGGVYYPYLGRNTQLRISVSATSSSGNVYSGYRFWGEVSDWPPLSDMSGSDVYVKVTASGPLRRIRKGGGKGSALTRYYNTLTGVYAPIAYWPCEEDPDTSIVGAGIDGGTDMSITTGTPKWKAASSFNGSAPVGVLNNSTWDGLTGSYSTSGDDIYDAPGTYTWVSPVSSVDCRVTAPGGGGIKGQEGTAAGGNAGAGAELAREATLAVTIGSAYTVTILPGGQAGLYNAGGQDGGTMSFAGDAVTVTAHGGKGATPGGSGTSALGGTGSVNSVHHDGGNGGRNTGLFNGGAGAGSSGGLTANGNAGSNPAGPNGAAGGAAVPGGGKGGTGGGFNGGSPTDGQRGSQPGGGGAGGWANAAKHTNGAAGAAGRIELLYTPATKPNNNVIRFLMQTPAWGGNQGKVLLRALTSGTVHQLDVLFDSTAKKLVLKGFNSVGGLLFTGNLSSSIAGQTLLVSAELSASGANVAWRLACVKPGGTADFDSVTGTQATATMGNVTEVIAAPNADITKTALGHISVQYAFIGLQKVSKALDGHTQEMGIDRFIRLANEQAMDNAVEFNEQADHWGFETGTLGWTGSNAAVSQSSVSLADGSWPSFGTKSLLLTAAGGAGTWSASSPGGTSGQPVNPGDIVSAAADVYCPAALGAVQITVSWWNGAGGLMSTSPGPAQAVAAGGVATVTVGKSDGSIAPSGASFFSLTVADAETKAASTLLYVDHVRVHPQMGTQTRKEYHKFFEEIEDLDQGIMKEAKELWGLKYRTRIRLVNQSPALILDYAQSHLSEVPAPVIDDQNVKNHIIVHRHKGSKVEVVLQNGQMSVKEPKAGGTGRYKKKLRVAAAADEQLLALATHLLNLGTVSDERYPVIAVNMARAGLPGNSFASLMSAVAAVEIGDFIKIVNLPFWSPASVTKQLVIGYTETISAFEWTIQWNCTPESPYELSATSIRRW